MHVQLSSGVRHLIFGLRLNLLPYFVYASSKGYSEIKKMYSKICLKRPLQNTLNKDLNGSLMKVKSIAECSKGEHSAILLTCIE